MQDKNDFYKSTLIDLTNWKTGQEIVSDDGQLALLLAFYEFLYTLLLSDGRKCIYPIFLPTRIYMIFYCNALLANKEYLEWRAAGWTSSE
jgi:hypothetical protein